MRNPKISIIIPAYNHGKELPKCLDSIFSQTLLSSFTKGGFCVPSLVSDWESGIFEIIIVNDGSTDGTKEVLKKYINACCRDEALPRLYGGGIKIINQPNQGAPVARNNGFKESKGDYVIFLDADIELRKDALEKMLGALEFKTPQPPFEKGGTYTPLTPRHPTGLAPLPAMSGTSKRGNNDRLKISYAYSDFRFGFKKFKLFPFDGEKLKKMNYIHTSALIRRDAFPEKGFDISLKKFQDWDLWLTMLEEGHIGVWIPEVLFKAKPRKQGMSDWLPRFMYRIPWAKMGIKINTIEKYDKWKDIVLRKHKLQNSPNSPNF